MPYVNKPRPYKKEYQQEKARGEHERRMERQRARRKIDASSPDLNGNGVADKREGKDIDHVKPIRAGGKTTAGNLRLRDPSENEADNKHGTGRKPRSKTKN